MTMQAPVLDLTNLRQLTGGDKMLEEDLFRTYIRSSVENIRSMQMALQDNNPAKWARNAHALKGASQNLGAGVLALAASDAEKGQPNDEALKKVIADFETVRDMLEKELGASGK
jgi:HPt (histidine-containing phosphotransfer) domain-containing protein